MGVVTDAFLMVVSLIVLAVLVLILAGVISLGQLSNGIASMMNTNGGILQTGAAPPYVSTVGPSQNLTYNYSAAYLYNYTLALINKDRAAYGLAPVALSGEPSGQQHADSMFENDYFSHWDVYGLKPYMRYTLAGGNGSVDENVATRSYKLCGALGCSGALNVTQSLERMEYNMMYNDSAEHWLHRDNILDANHTGVSIGIAYNSSTAYLVEDFVDDYVTWNGGTLGFSNGYVYLQGSLKNGYAMQSVLVSYDAPVTNVTPAQLGMAPYNDGYGYGRTVAGVAQSKSEYYQNLTTITAATYSVRGQNFDIVFDASDLLHRLGAGEYTVVLWVERSGATGAFLAATHTFFISSDGSQFTQANV